MQWRLLLSLLTFTAVLAGMLPLTAPSLQAAGERPLVLENGGLKNVYRVVFLEWDEKNSFARGAFEVQSHESAEPELRLTFAADLKPSKDKKADELEVRGTGMYFFFPPVEKKDPYPLVTWTLTGRKSGKPVLKAKLWTFNADKETWELEEMEFTKP